MSFFALVNCIKQTHEPFIFIKLTLKLKGILSLENSKGGGGGHHFRSLKNISHMRNKKNKSSMESKKFEIFTLKT